MPDILRGPDLPASLPEAGAVLLRRMLEHLAAGVPGAVGAALGAGRGEPPAWTGVLLAAVGAAAEPAWPADRVVAVRGPGEEQLVVLLVLDRGPDPADADRAAAALPGLAAAVEVLAAWADETERAEQMVQMVQYRRVIEQAKGLVMAVTGGDAAAAFATLARASQHFNVRLRNLAVALVELVGGAPAEGPDDPAGVVVPDERDRLAATRMWAALSAGGPSGRADA